MGADGAVAGCGEAVAAMEAGLGWLAAADPAQLTGGEQASCLRALEQAESRLTAARAAVLAAFTARRGFEADGHGGPKSWLRFQTRITGGAAAGAAGWMRRLAAHPKVAAALAAAQISASWARQLCDWTDALPSACRGDADAILLAAAAAGAGLRDLAALAEEIARRTATPDTGGDGFDDRSLRLEHTYGGAGRLGGDLTGPCTAALQAVLDALGSKNGPADTRTRAQRDHDALEEACRRLIAARCLPGRAGQPTQIQLHMTLDQLRGLPGAPHAETTWTTAQHGGPPAPPGADCDAQITPLVTGQVDHQLLSQLATTLFRPQDGEGDRDDGQREHISPAPGGTGHPDQFGGSDSARARPGRAMTAARHLLLARAADLLSGPAGLAAWLRTSQLTGLAATPSLPLDTGQPTDTIPPHLRRAVLHRDHGHCAFPGGCDTPAAAVQIHHLIPRSEGGPTTLANLGAFCPFHHLIVIHKWGWKIILHPDATYTATSPDGTRTLHTNDPPRQAA